MRSRLDRGVERRQHDDGAAEPHEAQQRRGAGHVEERGDGQQHVVALEAAGQRLVERVGDEVPMGQHHALGPAGGPAGEEDGRRIVLGRRSGDGRSGRAVTPAAPANGELGSAGGAAPASSASYSAPKRIVVSTASPNGPGSRSARRMRAPERRRASSSSGSAWRVLRGTITKPAAGTARWASTYRWQPAASTATRSPRCSPSAARAAARRRAAVVERRVVEPLVAADDRGAPGRRASRVLEGRGGGQHRPLTPGGRRGARPCGRSPPRHRRGWPGSRWRPSPRPA